MALHMHITQEYPPMNLPLVNPFTEPYESWTTRPATKEEVMAETKKLGNPVFHVRDTLSARVENFLEAAKYISVVGADNGLANHINFALGKDANYASWRKAMPPFEIYRHFGIYIADTYSDSIPTLFSMG